jgi:hypothetical protein
MAISATSHESKGEQTASYALRLGQATGVLSCAATSDDIAKEAQLGGGCRRKYHDRLILRRLAFAMTIILLKTQ